MLSYARTQRYLGDTAPAPMQIETATTGTNLVAKAIRASISNVLHPTTTAAPITARVDTTQGDPCLDTDSAGNIINKCLPGTPAVTATASNALSDYAPYLLGVAAIMAFYFVHKRRAAVAG